MFVAVHNTRTPMVICDPLQADNPIILANRAFLDLTGYHHEEVVGRNCRFLQGPKTDGAAIDILRHAVGQAQDVEVELLNYRKDGSTFWNRVSLSPVHSETGEVRYFFASQVDVTQHRQARVDEAERNQVLLREIDHRAMNALAIVGGIVRLSQARDIRQYAQSIQQRVQALAKAHAFLSKRRWQAAPLHEVLRMQLSPDGLRRVTLDGPDILIGATLVQPLALVLHEMVSNAATHGSLAAPTGALGLTWATFDGGRGFTLTWEETGGAPPPERRAPGFGSAIVAAIIERQLRGQADFQWRSSGLLARFTVPDTARELKPFQLTARP